MKRHLPVLSALALLAWLLAACAPAINLSPIPAGQGSLSVRVPSIASWARALHLGNHHPGRALVVADDVEFIVSQAGTPVDQWTVSLNSLNSAQSTTADAHKHYTPGSYSLTVNVYNLATGTAVKTVSGSASFTITLGQVTDVAVTCVPTSATYLSNGMSYYVYDNWGWSYNSDGTVASHGSENWFYFYANGNFTTLAATPNGSAKPVVAVFDAAGNLIDTAASTAGEAVTLPFATANGQQYYVEIHDQVGGANYLSVNDASLTSTTNYYPGAAVRGEFSATAFAPNVLSKLGYGVWAGGFHVAAAGTYGYKFDFTAGQTWGTNRTDNFGFGEISEGVVNPVASHQLPDPNGNWNIAGDFAADNYLVLVDERGAKGLTYSMAQEGVDNTDAAKTFQSVTLNGPSFSAADIEIPELHLTYVAEHRWAAVLRNSPYAGYLQFKLRANDNWNSAWGSDGRMIGSSNYNQFSNDYLFVQNHDLLFVLDESDNTAGALHFVDLGLSSSVVAPTTPVGNVSVDSFDTPQIHGVGLTWDVYAGATSYRVYGDATGSSSGLDLTKYFEVTATSTAGATSDGITATQMTNQRGNGTAPDLPANTTWYYWVTAVTAGGESPLPATSVSATTAVDPTPTYDVTVN